jgi:spoIIIJ-associated protein
MTDDAQPEDLSAEGEGDSLGEAKWAAMKELEPRFPGITADHVSFEVVEEAEGGVARVRAEVDEDAWRDAAEVIPEEPGERVRALVGRVVHALGLRATVDIEETADELRATVNGDELGLLIGKHGSTIDAVQHLAFRAAYRGDEEKRKQVTVDAAGYRERRETALHRMADRAAAEALRYDRPVELEPMRAPERKIVHTYLSERGDVETHSEGDEPDRRLVVSPAPAFRER